jgi:threonine/homoserine/homoserine lactone efflux protein
MNDPTLLLGAASAGFLYVVMPGPAFVALLALAASRGRAAGARFLVGHMAGDIVWSSLALVALIGARIIDRRVFDLLGLVCGVYLIKLGIDAWRASGSASGGGTSPFDRPLRHGLIFGLTNPKGYPVAMGMFAAMLGTRASELSAATGPVLLLASMVGVVIGALILVLFAGAAPVRSFYERNAVMVARAAGVLFVFFGLSAIYAALLGFVRS